MTHDGVQWLSDDTSCLINMFCVTAQGCGKEDDAVWMKQYSNFFFFLHILLFF